MDLSAELRDRTETSADPWRAEPEGPSPSAPRSLGRYVVLERLGSGGMGVVYAARDPDLDRTVAVKLLHGRDHDAASRERLRREAQAMASVHHPNVVAVYDVGEQDGDVFVAMELVRGQSLRQWLAEARPWPEVRDVFLAAGRGLAAAHAAGLVHRDFKPDNVLLGADGVVRVTDFGLVRSVQPRATTRPPTSPPADDGVLTREGAVVGTPAYMAPEQIEGAPVDARADQFSFCIALWEGLYGRRPFEADDIVALAAAILRGDVRDPPPDRAPSWLHRVVLRGLSVDPSRRWQSMDALLAALARDAARRRRRVGMAGFALAAVVGAIAWSFGREDSTAPCATAGEEIAAIWNLDVATALEARFVATQVPSARATATAVREYVDAWADRWIRSRQDACEATRVPATTSEAALDRRMLCLDRGLHELEATLAVLAEGDTKVVVRSVDAVRSLTSIDACDSAEVWNSNIDPPPPPLRAEVDAVEAVLADAKALLDIGRYADGLEPARRAVEAARRVGYAPLLARALHVHGRLQSDSALADGEETLLEAIHVAELAGDDRLAAEIWVQLLYDVGVGKGHLDDGNRWLPFAEAAVARAGNDPAILASLHNARGGMLYWERRYDEAMAAYEQVLRLREEAHGEAAPEAVQTLHNIALVQAAQGMPAEALANHRRALEADERVLGPDHPRVSYSLAYVGGLQEALGDHEGAVKTYERQLRIREQAFGRDNVKTVNVHRNIASALIGIGRLDDADAHARLVIAAHERSDNPSLSEAAAGGHSLLARTAELRDLRPEVLAHRRDALRLQEADIGADHPALAVALVDLADAEIVAGERDAAVATLHRALELQARPDRPSRDPELWQRARELLSRAEGERP